MSQLMIEAGAEKIDVPMKCDVEASFRWYDQSVPLEDCEEADKLYAEYNSQFVK